MTERFDARREQLLKELASDLADLVEAGEMTEQEANEWLARKADQWS
jgi:polyhydroxyalkanoate synthesis regulator phasin